MCLKAMILAAGRGERMRPLTEHTPKPLLKVGNKALIEYHLESLALAGVHEVIINIAYLGEQIQRYLGDTFYCDNEQAQLSLRYSVEPEPLETAGAILHALPLLGDQPFLLMNGDVWTDFAVKKLLSKKLENNILGHLVLVENPTHNLEGDFSVHSDSHLLIEKENPSYTFSGISFLDPKLVTAYPQCRSHFPLGEVFHYLISQKKMTAEIYRGQWWDIGTVERLKQLNERLKSP